MDWPTTRASIGRAAARATTLAQLHPAIHTVIQEAGGRHSGLLARRRRVGAARSAGTRGRGPRRLLGPVAVLTDERTASSGEAVAVAFRGMPAARSYGAATHGFSTGNEVVRLPDGALLVITTCRFADRAGQLYGGPLIPDVPAVDALAVALTELGQA